MQADRDHKVRTLWLCGVLHALTHVYHVALLPLYMLLQEDLELGSVSAAPFLVTIQGLAYFVPSYLMGVWADRFSRKRLLAIGLAINGLGYVGLAFAPSFGWCLAWVILAGLGGSFYHPAATALVARMFPVGTGRALGLVGIGASAGFFLGPIYSGWRADWAGDWRAPVLELGLLGLVVAAVFAWLAREEPGRRARMRQRPSGARLVATPALLMLLVAASIAFSIRDFAGSGMGSLTSLFLQQAQGLSSKATGLALSAIFVASAISNPLFGRFSDTGRIGWICFLLLAAAGLIAVFPWVPRWLLVPTLVLYGFFFLASYPIVEAALMESVHDSVRGRVFGLFITIGGLVGNLAHWLMGVWVNQLGDQARVPGSYVLPYLTLALLVLVALLGLPCLRTLRRQDQSTLRVEPPLEPLAPGSRGP